MEKQFFTDESLKRLVDKTKLYTDNSVEELSVNVAYIDPEDNENIQDIVPGNSNIIVDSALSTTSTNPVQNKVITNKINELLQNGNGGGVSSWNDLTDKPFYEETETKELLPETQAIPVDESTFLITETLPLSLGGTYTVNWNGTEYTSICVNMDGVPAIGNIDLMSGTGDTGEPFIIASIPPELSADLGMSGTLIMPIDGSTEVTLSISGETKTVHTLDNKYLDHVWIPNHKGELELVNDARSRNNYTYSAISYYVLLTHKTLIFYVDGVRYERTFDITNNDYYFGNYNILLSDYPDTGEPFLFNVRDNTLTCKYADASTYHELRVCVYDVDTLPNKFMPETLDRLIIRDSRTNDNDVSNENSFTQIAVSNGRIFTYVNDEEVLALTNSGTPDIAIALNGQVLASENRKPVWKLGNDIIYRAENEDVVKFFKLNVDINGNITAVEITE